MRIFVFILALLGGVGCGLLGLLAKSAEAQSGVRPLMELAEKITSDEQWEAEVRKQGKDPDKAREAIARYRQLLLLCYALLAAFPLSVGAGLLVLNRRGLLAAPLLLLAAVVPFYLTWRVAARQ